MCQLYKSVLATKELRRTPIKFPILLTAHSAQTLLLYVGFAEIPYQPKTRCSTGIYSSHSTKSGKTSDAGKRKTNLDPIHEKQTDSTFTFVY